MEEFNNLERNLEEISKELEIFKTLISQLEEELRVICRLMEANNE